MGDVRLEGTAGDPAALGQGEAVGDDGQGTPGGQRPAQVLRPGEQVGLLPQPAEVVVVERSRVPSRPTARRKAEKRSTTSSSRRISLRSNLAHRAALSVT